MFKCSTYLNILIIKRTNTCFVGTFYLHLDIIMWFITVIAKSNNTFCRPVMFMFDCTDNKNN